jgi:hypothetical protein
MVRATKEQMVEVCLRRPPGFMYWGDYDLFRTWGMLPIGEKTEQQVATLERRLTKKLGPEGKDSGWAVAKLADFFAGRRGLYAILFDVGATKAVDAAYRESGLWRDER